MINMLVFVVCFFFELTVSLVISYNDFSKIYEHMTGDFGPQTYNVSGPFVLASPVTYCPDQTDGKQVDIKGKIVLIERGSCNFVEKAYLAQLNFAIGVVIGDSNPQDGWIKMGSAGPNGSKIVIPSVSIQYYDFVDLSKLANTNLSINSTLDNRGEVYYTPQNPWGDLAWWTLPILGICMLMSFGYVVKRWCCERCQRAQRFNIASRMPLINYRSDNESDAKATNNRLRTSTEPYQALNNSNGNVQRQVHNENCAICLDDFVEGSRIKVLPCKHGFHATCIDPWLNERSDLCPICKTSILTATPDQQVLPSACATFCCPCRNV